MLLFSFLQVESEEQYNDYQAEDYRPIDEREVKPVVHLLPREVYHVESYRKIVFCVSVFLCHVPVYPVFLLRRSYGEVLRFCAMQYFCGSFRHVGCNGLRSGEIACNELAFGSTEVEPCGREHGFLAAHVHHHYRLRVVFHLHVCHFRESAHGEHQVFVAERVLLFTHCSVFVEVIE